jgi:hypothetical protein
MGGTVLKGGGDFSHLSHLSRSECDARQSTTENTILICTYACALHAKWSSSVPFNRLNWTRGALVVIYGLSLRPNPFHLEI